MGVDPLGEDSSQISTSPYAYVGNNPILFIDPDGKKKLRFELGGFFTTGILGIKAAIWQTPVGGSYDLGSTSTGGVIYIELDTKTAGVKIGATGAQEKGKKGSYEVGVAYLGYKSKELTTESVDINAPDGFTPMTKETTKEEGVLIGPFGFVDKTIDDSKVEEVSTMTIGPEIDAGLGLFGINLKIQATLTDD